MNLTPLINNGTLIPIGKKSCLPTSVSIDSRKMEKGGLFVAIPGYQQDGVLFIGEALKRGAVGIVLPQGVTAEKVATQFNKEYPEIAIFETPEIRKTASILAALSFPLQPDINVAVTGTNGKTSVVSFMRQIWHHLGIPAASLGTLGLIIEGKPLPPPTGTNGINTPDPVTFHHILQTLKEQKINALAFEATSGALSQNRLDSVHLKAGIFTNFSNDHLDYHHTMEAYFDAKVRLFNELLKPRSYAILNGDIPEYEHLLSLCKKRQLQPLTFGKKGDFVRLISITPKADYQDIVLKVDGKSYNLTLPLVGQFQVYNVMAALSGVIACGESSEKVMNACLYLKGIPGRLEQAAPGVYVDYAHTPEALSSVLNALRPHTKGKLWVVFGCGGNRDPFKRPMMGEIAAQFADKVIVTDDNPRHENPADIRQQILAKCPHATEIPSRVDAIRIVLESKQKEDMVLIAGKGHELYQLVGDQALLFNDVEQVKGLAL